jgi:hypothetical protein
MTYWGSFLTMVDFGRKTYIEFFLQSKIHTGKKMIGGMIIYILTVCLN